MLRNFVSWGFYPTLVFGSMALFGMLINVVLPHQYILIPLIINILIVAILILGEMYFPYHVDWLEEKGDGQTDFIQTFIGLPVASKLAEISLPLLLYFPLVWGQDKLEFPLTIIDQPLWAQFILILLLSEFLYYWIHRFSHQNPFLWRFHSVHHGAERVYWLNAGRFHFIDALIDNFFYLMPMVFIPCAEEVIVGILSLNLVTGYLEHANVDFKTGILKRIFNTAELHRWHHSSNLEEGNNNYGKVLSIWDQIFGTYFLPGDKKVTSVGLEGGKEVPNCIWKQMTYPFANQSPSSSLETETREK